MAQPIIKIKRGGAAPSANTLQPGEFAIDQVAKNLYLAVEVAGVITNEIVGGSGTYATKTYVGTAITTATGSLGTMSTQNAVAVAITGGAINGTTIGATTPSTGAFTTLTASSAPSASNDVVRKTDLDAVDAKVNALSSAFNYVGTVSGGATSGAATNLASLTQKDAGDYYKVAAAGYFVLAPAAAFYANQNDGLVFNLSSGIDKIDNTDSTVAGTANEITVTGSTDTGYTAAIATEFKTRVSTLETTAAGLGTISTQNASNVAITGGTINGTTIGGTTAAAGSFTTIAASGQTTLTGNLVGTGTNQITDFVIDGGVY